MSWRKRIGLATRPAFGARPGRRPDHGRQLQQRQGGRASPPPWSPRTTRSAPTTPAPSPQQYVHVGDQVAAGQPLFEVESAALRA